MRGLTMRAIAYMFMLVLCLFYLAIFILVYNKQQFSEIITSYEISHYMPITTLTAKHINNTLSTVNYTSTSASSEYEYQWWYKRRDEECEMLRRNVSSVLSNLSSVYFPINRDVCGGGNVYAIIFIHSSPGHDARREILRDTWANWRYLQRVLGVGVRVVFLVGEVSERRVQLKIEWEQIRHGDIVQVNIRDTYENLTYKHLAGLRWSTHFCSQAKYILKTDDDVFIDIIQLIHYLRQQSEEVVASDIICHVFYHAKVHRETTHKWRLTKDEYSSDTFPPYCWGPLIVYTPKAAVLLLGASTKQKYLWVDDAFISGVLAHKSHLKHLSLKLSTYGKKMLYWLHRGNAEPFMYLAGLITVDEIYVAQLLHDLWRKTLLVNHLPLPNIYQNSTVL